MVEGRILVEDAVLQIGQAGRRVDPQLVAQHGSQLMEGRERLGVPSLPVQRQHQLAARALAERMARHQGSQLPGDVAMAAERELGVDPVFDGEQPELVEVCGRGRGERLRELPERRPAPKRTRGGEALGRRIGVAVGERLAPLLAQPLEPQQVDGLRRDLDPVARRARLQRPARQNLAKLGDVDVHHLHRRGGHALAPQRVDERIDRHGPVRLEQQAGEQRALALPAGGHGLAAVHDLKRAEEPVLRPVVRELHGPMPDARLVERRHRLRIARPASHDTTVPGCRRRRHGAASRPRCGLPHRSRRPEDLLGLTVWHGRRANQTTRDWCDEGPLLRQCRDLGILGASSRSALAEMVTGSRGDTFVSAAGRPQRRPPCHERRSLRRGADDDFRRRTASVSQAQPQTTGTDEDQASAGAQFGPTALLHP